eukprot:TRINITY_DN15548_c0_g1_i1.p1 TRINITY_DN15548_c0_g1~~TRINITY_DN15548_c0_g1_i1.p1  ORF type:complete len:1074 (+),score=270.41 TRINITY_DN15548_c0_g1_i1:92-3313(+)
MALTVHSADGVLLTVPEAAIFESKVFAALIDTDDGTTEGGEASLHTICHAAELEALFELCRSQALFAKERASLIRDRGVPAAARLLHCAHYLDAPRVLEALVDDFAGELVNLPTVREAAELLQVPSWATSQLRDWPAESRGMAERLLGGLGPKSSIGTRAQILAAAWCCEDSPLASLPEDVAGLVLQRADVLCAEALGASISAMLRDTSAVRRGITSVDDIDKAFATLEKRRDHFLNSPIAISAAVAWALAPTSRSQTRQAAVRALRALCTFGNKDAFDQFLAVVDGRLTTPVRDPIALTVAAFQALPTVIDKEEDAQANAVVEAASDNILHPDLQVRTASIACLGAVAKDPPAVFRYITRATGLDVLAECTLAERSVEDALENSLRNLDPQVRRAAAESIGVYISKGGEGVAKQMLDRLAGVHGALAAPAPEYRVAAVSALRHLMQAVQLPDGWQVLANCLLDPVSDVRNAARVAIQSLAGVEGCAVAVFPHLHANLACCDTEVRAELLEIAAALARMCASLDGALSVAEEMALATIQDVSDKVCVFALRLMFALGRPPEGTPAVVALSRQCQRRSPEMRLEACRTLSVLAAGYDREVVMACSEALVAAGAEEHVVELAGLLRKVVKDGRDGLAADAFAAVLDSGRAASCQIACLRGLEAVAPVGHKAARAATLQHLHSEVPSVVEAAVNALMRVCTPGDKEAIGDLTHLVADQVHTLRPPALTALAVLCSNLRSDPSCAPVLDVLRARLTHGHWPVRRAALEAFGELAPRGSVEVFQVVQAKLDDTSVDVRQTAVEVLVKLAHPLEKEVVEILMEVQMAIDEAIDILVAANTEAHEAERQALEVGSSQTSSWLTYSPAEELRGPGCTAAAVSAADAVDASDASEAEQSTEEAEENLEQLPRCQESLAVQQDSPQMAHARGRAEELEEPKKAGAAKSQSRQIAALGAVAACLDDALGCPSTPSTQAGEMSSPSSSSVASPLCADAAAAAETLAAGYASRSGDVDATSVSPPSTPAAASSRSKDKVKASLRSFLEKASSKRSLVSMPPAGGRRTSAAQPAAEQAISLLKAPLD